mmetsp:Transcript_27944/g.34489  ORF Transcript_27944/g.34489 Transcript_27944/m.34489 type:complete len:462 (-) Transcript_27944:39-1424(-)
MAPEDIVDRNLISEGENHYFDKQILPKFEDMQQEQQDLSSAFPSSPAPLDSRQSSFNETKIMKSSRDSPPSTEPVVVNSTPEADPVLTTSAQFTASSPLSSEEQPQKVRFSAQSIALLQESNPRQSTPTIPSSSQKKKKKVIIANTKTSAATRPSVFERLSNTETVASLHQKFLPAALLLQHEQEGTRKMKRSTSAPPSMRTRAKNVVERLSEKHTKTSKNRKRLSLKNEKNQQSNEKIIKNNCENTKRNYTIRSNSLGRKHDRKTSINPNGIMRSRERRLSFYKQQEQKKKIIDTLDDAFDIHSDGPPLEIEFQQCKTKILCSQKFNPGLGFQELDSVDLGLSTIRFTEYETGNLSAKEFASEIMHLLIWKHIPLNNGIKWVVRSPPLERELAMPLGETGFSYVIEAMGKNILDGEDSEEDSVQLDAETCDYNASVSANVTFSPDWDIYVENFSCVHDVE